MSRYFEKLEKARAENLQNAVLVDKYQGAVKYNLSPDSFARKATEAGAKRKIGGSARYSVAVCDKLFGAG